MNPTFTAIACDQKNDIYAMRSDGLLFFRGIGDLEPLPSPGFLLAKSEAFPKFYDEED